MSKRVLIILAVGFVAIIAAFFLMKHELSQDLFIEDPQPEDQEPKKPRKTKKVTDENQGETDAATTEPGTATGTDTNAGTNEE